MIAVGTSGNAPWSNPPRFQRSCSTLHICQPITGRLAIKTFEDRIEDGFGLVRTDVSPPVEVAVIHDGSDRGVGEAADYARLLALAPVMLRLITDALGAWAE